jgi:hypothetical protein
MNSLGQSLVFYLRHSDEMNRLYWHPRVQDRSPDLTGLEGDQAELVEMLKAVGDAASRESARFLSDWGSRIEQYLGTIARNERVRTKGPPKDWGIRFRIWTRDGASNRFDVGLYVHSALAQAIGWIYCRKGLEAEVETLDALGRGPDAPWRPSSEVNEDQGVVLFARVDLLPKTTSELDHDRDPLVAKAAAPILSWTERQIVALTTLSRRR